MPDDEKTPLELRFLQLPKCIDFELDIMPELKKSGISHETFKLDCLTEPFLIPHERLQAYADIFNCKVEQLLWLNNGDST